MAAKPYLTPHQAAALLMVSPATLRVWADKGLVKASTTAGGHRRFLREDLERFRAAGPRALQDASPATRVLIVDDDMPLTRYLSALLDERGGVITALAHDGFTAGQMLHTFRPDLLLLDLMMPGVDGFQVCQQIREQPATRDIRVIAMTGYPTAENVARALDAGAEACLPKPLDEARLLALLAPAPEAARP